MTVASELEREGRVWIRRALDDSTLASLDRACALDTRPGARLAAENVQLGPLDQIVADVLPGARPVRVVAFNKSEDSNWTLPWHQDRVVALRDRANASEFHNWTRKSGIWHAEPPIDLLEQMIFVRVHLDAANQDNGCLQLALGTHARGKIEARDAEIIAANAVIENCIADRGDVLIAKALILHRSSSSHKATARRALRVDYCAEQLPAPLQWAA